MRSSKSEERRAKENDGCPSAARGSSALALRLAWPFSAAAFLMALAACQPAVRYRTLSFFFDGVPDPNAPQAPSHTQTREAALYHPEPRATPDRPIPPPIVSVHKPYAENQCQQCHDMSKRFVPMAVDPTLCDKCHKEQRIREGWDHGPVNLGTCIPCHSRPPHDSIWPHLLAKPVPDLCLDCHLEDVTRVAAYHLVPELPQCTLCHDAHRMY